MKHTCCVRIFLGYRRFSLVLCGDFALHLSLSSEIRRCFLLLCPQVDSAEGRAIIEYLFKLTSIGSQKGLGDCILVVWYFFGI